MPSTLRVRSLIIVFLTILALCLIPLPASSRPVIMSDHAADDGTLPPNPSSMDAVGLFLALSVTCLWITNRVGVIRFAGSDISLLAAPITVAEQLAQQLSYLRFTTLLRIATANALDADDAGLEPARPRVQGGLSRPVSSAPRSLEPSGRAA